MYFEQVERAQDTEVCKLRFGQRLCAYLPPLPCQVLITAFLAVTTPPCSCCDAWLRGKVPLYLVHIVGASAILYTDSRYGLSVTQTDTHECCIALESFNRRERNNLLGPFDIFEIEKIMGKVICKDNLAKGCILHS